MAIERRIGSVNLPEGRVDSSYRAAIHKKFSDLTPELSFIRDIIDQDFTQVIDPVVSRLTERFRDDLLGRDPNRIYVELSPLGPFGIDSFLTKTSALKVAHVTGRPADVVADPTIQLATEAYRQRKKGNKAEISLGTSHRCIRLQRYENPQFSTSFEMFATLDTTENSTRFYEEEETIRLIKFYHTFIKDNMPGANIKINIGNIRIAEGFTREGEAVNIEEKAGLFLKKLPSLLKEPIKPKMAETEDFKKAVENANITRELKAMWNIYNGLSPEIKNGCFYEFSRILGLGHYNGPVFMIVADDIVFVDGGSVDWVAKLMINNRQRSVVSGFGIELFAKNLVKK